MLKKNYMVSIKTFRALALSFAETSEQPHFEKISFRVGKKIFATYDEKYNRVCIKLSEMDQHVFSLYNKEIIYPVPNKWGKQGWTFIELKTVPKAMFIDAIKMAYNEVAPKNLKIIF
jgi:predicted DNA-binding protein (MmcQ/YjbR family)